MNGKIVSGYTLRREFGCGKLYLTVNGENNQIVQVLMQLGKSGCCQHALLEAVARLVNAMLDAGLPTEVVSDALRGIQCNNGTVGRGRLSCVDALARELRRDSHAGEVRETSYDDIPV